MEKYKKTVSYLMVFFYFLLPLQFIFRIVIEEPYPSFVFPGFASLPVKDNKYITFVKTSTTIEFKDGKDTVLVQNNYLGEKIPRTIQITLIQNLLFPKKSPVLDERIKTLPLYKRELYLLKKRILNRNIKKVDIAKNEKFVKQQLKKSFSNKEISWIFVKNEKTLFDIKEKKITDSVTIDTVFNYKFDPRND